ncbi:MAG: hypothetical protein WEC17_01785 [Candidatus Saccharimonadales bacterium]
MPKNAEALILMAICVVAAFFMAVARPDIAEAKPSSGGAGAHIRSLKVKTLASQSAIRFWEDRERGRWMLHLRHDKCWNVRGKQRREVCKKARKSFKYHEERLARLASRIDKLSAPRDTGYLPPEQARELGQRMAAAIGWTGEQWKCLDALWGRYESSWYVYADNPRTEAYGIPQALPGSKMGTGWQRSAYVQIKWGLGYVRGRFGSPCSALSYRLVNGWY